MSLSRYTEKLNVGLSSIDQQAIDVFVKELMSAWDENRQLLVCGNGGSAANALHWVNDFIYGLGCGSDRSGMRAIALSANQAVVTCLGNDIGYEQIFAEQVRVHAQEGDLLVVLSGSGNSANILQAIEAAKTKGARTFAVLGYDGGKALSAADHAVHVNLDDMQIAEDIQVIVGHYIVREMRAKLGISSQ
jgi:D-sedoheptulose 7-phosphate isomerase